MNMTGMPIQMQRQISSRNGRQNHERNMETDTDNSIFRSENDYTDNGSIAHRENGSGTKDAMCRSIGDRTSMSSIFGRYSL